MLRKTGVGVALLIAVLTAGCASRGSSTPSTPSGQATQVSQPPAVGVVLREFEIEPRPVKVRAGTVRFLVMNRGSVDHDFIIPSLQGHDAHEQHLINPGKTQTVELELKPGSYEAICTVPGHKEAGMTVMVEVSL